MGFIFSGSLGSHHCLDWTLNTLKCRIRIRVPFFRIAFALFLIWLGITLLTGRTYWSREKNKAIFEEKRIDSITPPKQIRYHFC